MRFSARGVFALLLILAVTLSGLACSTGKSSEISQADIAKLNTAGTVFSTSITTLETKARQEVPACAGDTNAKKCVKKQLAVLDPQMQSAANTWAAAYDEVAGGAHGACQTSLHAMARSIRAYAAKISGSVLPNTPGLVKGRKAVVSACKLKIVSK